MHCERPALIIAAQLMHKQRSQQVPLSGTNDQIAASWSETLPWQKLIVLITMSLICELLETNCMFNEVTVNSLRKHYIWMWVKANKNEKM